MSHALVPSHNRMATGLDRRSASIMAAITLIAFAATPAQAATYNWNGPDGALWSVGPWVDTLPGTGQVAVFSELTAGQNIDVTAGATAGGITFNNNVANTVIKSTGSNTLSLNNAGGGVVILADAGSHTISASIDSMTSADACDFKGAGTIILSGTNKIGVPGGHWVHGWGVEGNLEITGGSTTVAPPVPGTANDGGISGTMVVSGGSFAAGGHDVGISGTLTVKGTGSFTLSQGGIYDTGGGTLNIQDTGSFTVDRGVLNDPATWTLGGIIMGMGWGPSNSDINQDNGTVNLPYFDPAGWELGNAWGLCFGPLGGGVVTATYHLNGGVLNAWGRSIFR